MQRLAWDMGLCGGGGLQLIPDTKPDYQPRDMLAYMQITARC